MNKHASVMNSLAERHEVLLPLLRGARLHYLDLPFHGNVGDLLIMQGTLRFFQRHRLPVERYGMYFNYSPTWARPGDVIVLHGGGNFGDIYGPFQAFRERVIAALPNNRIVIMPQSMHFSDPAKFDQCCAIFSCHPDLHICVRDLESQRMALCMTRNVYLLPDMAHQLWPMARSGIPDQQVLRLLRRDSEAPGTAESTVGSFDWDDLVGKNWRFFLSEVAERSMFHVHRLGLNKPLANLEARMWIAQAEVFSERAAALFSRHEKVVSNRLHAHILSSLLGIPNDISDNSYGKNSRYISTWTSESPLVTLKVPAPAHAEELVA